MEKTKAAQMIADYLINLAQGNTWGAMAVVYLLVTLVTTELITNAEVVISHGECHCREATGSATI